MSTAQLLLPRFAWIILAAALAAIPASGEPLYVASDHVGEGTFTTGVEGPASGPDGALYAVNFGREGTIGRVTIEAGVAHAQLFVDLPGDSVGNGIRFDARGHMYVADYVGHRILRIDPRDRSIAVHAHDPRMHQPNDIAIAPDGTLYASDPRWSHGDGQLWRIDVDGGTHLLETGMGTTNGIEVSPDGRSLYVNESVQRGVWAYDIGDGGALSGKRLLIRFDDHGLDGMRTDAAGNLYIARYGAGSVAIVSPDGALLHEVALKGALPSNVAFGGSDGRSVFVTLQDRGAIETFRSAWPGREAGGR
ncbi:MULTISPECIES: SMP-30/gluconolactonase/LRE family protein [unclassified Luteimonas]